MKKTCNKYRSYDISMFVDNELPCDQYHSLAQHIDHCPECSRLAEQYRSISTVFNDHADHIGLKIEKIDQGRLNQKLAHTIQNSGKKSLENMFGFFGKNRYLKLASIAVILVISLFAFQGNLFSPSGSIIGSSPDPSAIVKYIDTDFTSVMIIETQKEKHTIIWFSET